MQKLNLKTQLALLLAVAVAPFAGISAAGLIDNNVYGQGSASVNTSIKGNTNINTSANTDIKASTNSKTDTNTNTNTNIGTNSNVRLTGSSTVAHDEEMNGSSNGSVSGSAGQNDDSDINVSQDSDEVRGSLGAEIHPFNVMTKSDLKAFAASELKGDTNLTHLAFGKDSVEIGYKVPGRFLGLFPLTMNARAIVASDGKVLVHYPWYHFLVVGDKAEVKTEIETEVSSYLSSTTPLTFTPGIEAELAARIKAIIASHFINAGGTASTTASGTAQ